MAMMMMQHVDFDVGQPDANYQYLLAMDIGEPCDCIDCRYRAEHPAHASIMPFIDDDSLSKSSHFEVDPIDDDEYRDRRLTEFSPL